MGGLFIWDSIEWVKSGKNTKSVSMLLLFFVHATMGRTVEGVGHGNKKPNAKSAKKNNRKKKEKVCFKEDQDKQTNK